MSTLHVELLTTARELVESGARKFVCNALFEAGWRGGRDFERANNELTEHILMLVRDGVEDRDTLDSWLVEHIDGASDLYRKNYTEYLARARATRLAWIDWLIEEWRDAP